MGGGGQIINKGATICHLNKIPSYDFSKALLSLIYSCILNFLRFFFWGGIENSNVLSLLANRKQKNRRHTHYAYLEDT